MGASLDRMQPAPSRSPGPALPRPAPIEWVALAIGGWLTLRYAWLMDDAFVFFRYVDNLLFLGRGLVFNEGEYVEGFSSPAWTLLLIPLRATGANYWLLVRVLGVVLFAAFWLLLVALRGATQPAPGPGAERAPVVNLPLVFLGALYPVACYFTSGMETGLVQVAAAAFALHAFRPDLRLPAVVVGLAPLVRPELAVPVLGVLAWDWVRSRRFPWLPFLVAASTSGGWLVFRVWYYADLFPNTFHLKDGVRLDWGLAYLHDALVPYGAYVLLALVPALALALAARGVRVQAGPRLFLGALALVVAAYVVKIGGDGRHYRYLAFPFCLAACASAGLVERALLAFTPRLGRVGATALGLVLLIAFGSRYPRQLSAHPLSPGVTEERVGVIRDAQYHRAHDVIGYSPWSSGAETEAFSAHEAELLRDASGEPVAPEPELDLRLRDEYERYLREVRPTREPITRPGSWCYDMWKRFNVRWIHKDGLTDAVLARVAAEPWRPGHYDERERAPLLRDMMQVQNDHGWRPGAYRQAVEAGQVGDWVARGLESIELIELKIHNRHQLVPNLRLALTPVPPIEPPPPLAPAAREREGAPGR